MTIIAARYSDETSIPIIVTLDTGSEIRMPSYPSGTHYDRQMADFLDGGGTIVDYDQYYGISDNDLREQKYNLNAELAQAQVEAAEATPIQGTTLDGRETKKEKRPKKDGTQNQRKKSGNLDRLLETEFAKKLKELVDKNLGI